MLLIDKVVCKESFYNTLPLAFPWGTVISQRTESTVSSGMAKYATRVLAWALDGLLFLNAVSLSALIQVRTSTHAEKKLRGEICLV